MLSGRAALDFYRRHEASLLAGPSAWAIASTPQQHSKAPSVQGLELLFSEISVSGRGCFARRANGHEA